MSTVATVTRPPITPVEKLVLDTIKAVGPVSFSYYMQLCLSHPTHGYYMDPNNAVFGQHGDFITSPEITQVFGELLAVWFVLQWQNAGAPSNIRLVELGPGRGTLMNDILRAVGQFSAVKQAKIERVHLIDSSPTMRELQKKTLAHGGWDVVWNDGLEEIKPTDAYTMVIAHEFFDALPINILEKRATGWHEVRIDAQPEPDAYPRLRRVLTPEPTPASTLLGNSSERFKTIPDGAHVEISQVGFRVANQVAGLLADSPAGGSALFIDYGSEKPAEDSFRAFKDHKNVDALEAPGQCDVTADVDFGFLKEALDGGVMAHGPMPQGHFLGLMGIGARMKKLLEAAPSDERRQAIVDAGNRIMDPAAMGKEYQVMGITAGKTQEVWPFSYQPQQTKDV
ncbi:DUF185-domain-containing protein [Cylindrobasidium torrendii FP15055 ss-10]|uniref:Protein arginine methyltransferase NDUFAF7 n=1 Tax=Cylindrobasidium torrendii FP15055 ss-10 TaxID=1314674 RepID=A0A0D7BKW1_9AGAR|nr:DUF185-domain-containing protein [Cylindrobasidium torrendii FP15055 ss-10]